MLVGVDFDNTIACYDDAFYRAALEKKLIPIGIEPTKKGIRDHLREIDREDDWTELQGYIYGARMDLAAPFPGVIEFLGDCVRRGIAPCIISHKTRFPYLGPKYDLHGAALGWLEALGMFDPTGVGLPRGNAFFELTKEEKLARIAAEGCTVFIDDLPEFLAEEKFPHGVERILFDPNDGNMAETRFRRLSSWDGIASHLLREA